VSQLIRRWCFEISLEATFSEARQMNCTITGVVEIVGVGVGVGVEVGVGVFGVETPCHGTHLFTYFLFTVPFGGALIYRWIPVSEFLRGPGKTLLRW
jgi:hypothetical protein